MLVYKLSINSPENMDLDSDSVSRKLTVQNVKRMEN